MFRANSLVAFLLSIFCFTTMAADRPRVVQGIRVPVASLDPFSTTGIDAFSAMSNVIEPLFRIHPSTGELMPCLGLSYKLDPKKKTIRVKLRPHVHFQNGDPLTGGDVQFTFEAYYKPEFEGAIWRGMWSEVESARAIDSETVEFKLKEWRYPYFISVLTSLRILPRAVYGKADKKKFQNEITGSGPFRVKRFESNRKFELEPNPSWWGSPKPNFDLTIKATDDAALAAQMIQKGEMDFYLLEAGQAKPPGVMPAQFKSGLGRGFWIDLNFRNKLFQSKNVRQALLRLWNREELNKKVFRGEMTPALDVFTPNSETVPRGKPVRMNVKEARRLLELEGWKDSDHDGILEKNNEKLRFTILVANGAEERWVSLYQQDARKAGVQVVIERIGEDAQWIERLKSGNFDAFASDGALINRPEKYSWASDGIYNYSKYKNAEVDRLTEELDLEFNPEKRRLITRKLIEIIRADVPQIPGLITRYESILLSKRLRPDPENPTRAWLWTVR